MPLPYQQALHLAKRFASPFMAQKADSLLEETVEFAAKAGPDLLGGIKAGETAHKWLRRGEDFTQPIYRRIIDDFHSPEMVLGRDLHGQAIIDSATKWDMKANQEIEPILSEYSKLSTWIGKGSKDDEAVFSALENPTTVGLLKPRARMMYEFMKSNYDFTAQRRIEFLAGDPDTANKIIRLAAKPEVSEVELANFTASQLQALDFAKRLRTNYAPHVFDRDKLIELFSSKLDVASRKLADTKTPRLQEFYGKQIASLEESLKKLSGGEPLTWETLPKEFAFQHQKVRKGEEGFVNSARQSFESYIHNYKNATFDDTAVKEMASHYDQLPAAMRPYAKWFIREYAGYNTKNAWDKVAGWISSSQYIRTMGLNPRSAVMNLTQGVNTLIDANPLWTAKGYVNMWTPKLKELWDKTGLNAEIPSVLNPESAPYATKLETAKRITGFFFRLAETFNRKHAFSTYFTKAVEKLGMAEEDAIQYAIKGVHKTQFQYGRVGMPKALRTPAGKVFGQFSSFSIKQLEFLQKQLRDDPKKALYWVGATALGNVSAEHVLGWDLSNALGLPMNFGEAAQAFTALTRGELDETLAHGKMLFTGGSGILPTSIGGPTTGTIMDISKAMAQGKPVDALKAFVPVQWERAANFLHTIEKRLETGQWNRYNKDRTELLDRTGLGEQLQEFLGPKSAAVTKKSSEWYKQQVFDKLEMGRKRTIAEAIINGNTKRANKLISDYKLVPTEDMLAEAMMKKFLPREQREKWQKSKFRQERREASE